MRLTHEEKRNLVLNGNIYKALIILSLPIIFNNLMQTFYNLADMYWIGRISDTDIEVGAIGGVASVTNLIIAFGSGLYVTASSLMSQSIGGNNKKRAEFIAGQALFFSVILGFVMMILGLTLNPYIVNLIGFKGETYRVAVDYLSILFYEIPVIFAAQIFTAMRQAQGDTLTPVILSCISVVLNVVLDPLFIFVIGWGVKGAAFATILSKFLVLPIWLVIATKSRTGICIRLKNMLPDFSVIKTIVLIAIPASAGQAINSAGFVVLQRFVYGYGEATQSAFNITNNINSLAMMPAMGVGSALAFVIGQNIGNNNIPRAKKAFKATLLMTLAFGLVGMTFMLLPFTGRAMVKFFLDEKETIDLAMYFLIFVAANTPLMGIFQSITGVFQGSGKTTSVFIMTVARLWLIRIPIIYFFQKFTNVGSVTLYIAMLASNVLVIVVGFMLYFRGTWQIKIVDRIKDKPELA